MIIEAREDTITLRGSVKDNIWPAIQAAAALLLENHPTGIIVDASAVTKITAKGAETFADAFEYIQAKNARIVVAGLSEEMLEVGRMVPGVRSQLPIAATVDEARASLQLEEITPARGKAREAGIVPMLGNWKRAVYMADKLAIGANCEIHLVDLIKVPRTLPIGSPQPEREAAGQGRLEEAKQIVRGTRISNFTHIERVRSYSSGLMDFAGQLNADFAIVSLDTPDKTAPNIDKTDAITLLETAQYEVTLLKGAPDDYSRAPRKVIIPAVAQWTRALDHVCKLCSGEQTEITVAYMIAVPRSEPLDAYKPDEEIAASDMSREATRIGKKYGLKVNPVTERVRDAVLGFMKMVESDKFDLAVVGVRDETEINYHIAHAIAGALLQDLPCETAFLKVSEEQPVATGVLSDE